MSTSSVVELVGGTEPYVGRLAVAPDGGRWRADRTLAYLADRLRQDDLVHRRSRPCLRRALRRALPHLREQLPERLQPRRQDTVGQSPTKPLRKSELRIKGL